MKGGRGKGSRNEILNEPIYANILEVDLDLEDASRILMH